MRSLFQNLAIATCVLMLVAVADGCWQAFHESGALFRVVAGQSALASGDLVIPSDREGVRLHAEITAGGLDVLARHVTARLDAPGVSLRFIELKGRLWRGELTATPDARRGEYRMAVVFGGQPLEEAPVYTVRVFPTREALSADLASFIHKHFSIQPWWVALGCMPVALCFGLVVFRIAGRDLDRLLASGIGPIYKLAKRRDGWEVVFGLGSDSGVRDGDELVILDPRYQPVGQLTARGVGAETAQAVVPFTENISPGHFVARRR